MVAPTDYISEEEYLARERLAETKSEYFNGRIYPMTGFNLAHNCLTMSIIGHLGQQLRHTQFHLMASQMRTKISAIGFYTYPDLLVCDEAMRFTDESQENLLNPLIIIEVLSPSTEAYDRGEKFARYRRLDSLTDYILISQDRMSLEHFRRQENGDWLLHEVEQPTAVLTIESIGCRLVVSEVYERVTFPEELPSGS